jgi:hypothetical protein
MVFENTVRLLGNEAGAGDIAQSVFLKAFQRFENISLSPAAAGWLKPGTRNNHSTFAASLLAPLPTNLDDERHAIPYGRAGLCEV